MDGVNYKSRQVHVEVAETRSEGDSVQEERPVRERKPRREEKAKREEKPRRVEKPKREEKKPRREEKSFGKVERHRAQRAPKVQIAQDDDFWNNFENEDWHQFFRSEGGKPRSSAGRNESKPSKRKEKKTSGRKEKVNGRKASRTVTKPKKSRR